MIAQTYISRSSSRLPIFVSHAAAVVIWLLAALQGYAESFRIVVIPDTQWAARKWPHLISNMTTRIADNREKEDIRYVLHVGDMVQVGNSDEEWKNFDTSMRILEEAKVPALARGSSSSRGSLSRWIAPVVPRFGKRGLSIPHSAQTSSSVTPLRVSPRPM
jgi:hypothetical protein